MDPEHRKTLHQLGEIPSLLTYAVTSIKTDNPQEALSYLRKSEELLEAAATHTGCTDPDLVSVTLQNTALAYQKLGMYEECASYLDGCAFNAKNKTALDRKNTVQLHTVKMKKAKELAKTQLQLCATLSQLRKHEAALSKARLAGKYSARCVQEAYYASLDFVRSYKRAKGRANEENAKAFELVVKRIPLLEFLVNKTSGKTLRKTAPGKQPKLDLRSALGVQNCNDWIYSYSIEDIMSVEPLSLSGVKQVPRLVTELSKDLMLETVFFI